MAKYKLDVSDVLGKLHIAALEKVNSQFKGVWGALKKLRKGEIGTASIVNTAFHENNKQLDLPPNKAAQIVVRAAGTNARKAARDMAKVYMQWFAGDEDFDIVKYVENDESNAERTTKDKSATILGQGVVEYRMDYQLYATQRAAQDLEDLEQKTNKTASDKASSEDSDVIDANESVESEETPNKVKAWESEHPFKSIFTEQNKEDTAMLKESKTKKFVKQVAKQKNVAAQRTLEEIIREKVEKRVKDVLSEEK